MVDSTSVLSESITQALVDGCTKVAQGATEGIAAVIPLGLNVFAITVGLRIALNFFRSLAH